MVEKIEPEVISLIAKGEVEAVKSADGEHFTLGDSVFMSEEEEKNNTPEGVVTFIQSEISIGGLSYANIFVTSKTTGKHLAIYTLFNLVKAVYKVKPAPEPVEAKEI